jgi:hypothetical protein
LEGEVEVEREAAEDENAGKLALSYEGMLM